jgi:hypothetical protein
MEMEGFTFAMIENIPFMSHMTNNFFFFICCLHAGSMNICKSWLLELSAPQTEGQCAHEATQQKLLFLTAGTQ